MITFTPDEVRHLLQIAAVSAEKLAADPFADDELKATALKARSACTITQTRRGVLVKVTSKTTILGER